MEGVLLRNFSGLNYSNGLCKDFGGFRKSDISKVFMNNDHKGYYGGNKELKIRCNLNDTIVVEKDVNILMNDEKVDKKVVKKQKMMMKKRSKLLKGLSRDILAVSGLAHDGLKFQEASEVLLAQLKQLRSEQKELKKKMKEEKAKKKAAADSSSSSSSSSESSDSECEREVVDMSRLKRETDALPQLSIRTDEEDLQLPENEGRSAAPAVAAIVQENYTVPQTEQDCSNSLIRLLEDAKEEEKNTKKLEVCMGGKCKKSGAGVLLEEFQRVLGETDPAVDVVGCKCMGKCRDGPNVRLVSSSLAPPPIDVYDEPHHLEHNQVAVATAAVAVTDPSSILTRSRKRTSRPSHPLCIGVGLDDVGFIVSKLVGDR